MWKIKSLQGMYKGTYDLILALKTSTSRSGHANGISFKICLLQLTKLDWPMRFCDASKKYSLSGYLGRERDYWIRRIVSSRLVRFLQSPCSFIVSLITLNGVKDLIFDLIHSSRLERFLVKSKQCCLRILNIKVLILLISETFKYPVHTGEA